MPAQIRGLVWSVGPGRQEQAMPSCCDAVVAVRSGGEGWVKAGPAFPSRAIGARPGAIAHQAAGSFRLRTLSSLEAIEAAG